MSDITKCTDSKCPSRKQCWRYMAKPNPHAQSYGDFNRADGAERCADGFWPVEKEIKP